MSNVTSDCINWVGSIDNQGYGVITRGKKKHKAHRVVYEAANGSIPDGLSILHKCDNRSCVNVRHLYAGTHQDNMRDMRERNRAKGKHLGESHGRHKLKESEVIEIKRRLSKGDPMLKIAQDYGVNHMTIKSIKSGRTWGWLQFSPTSKEA